VTELHVSCATEGGYVAHSAAMLHSVLARGGGLHVTVHYLHGPDLTSRDRGLLRQMVERAGGRISFLEIADERLHGLPTRGFTRKATWYRIFLPELLPAVERTLYLDADLIVVDSLEPLWTTDVSDHYVAAVTNVFERHEMHRPAELGLPGLGAYFNAGVMLMNLDLMRRDGCTDSLRRYGATHAGELRWRDQDALNVVLGPRRLSLHPRWNLMNSILLFPWSAELFEPQALAEARGDPAIRHFEGPSINKPWHYLCEHELRELYFEHRRHTPWPRYRLEGVTPANVLRRLGRGLRGRRARAGRPGGAARRHSPSA
jgi:lipopolysaccharide biosynthesis glycosyltransferase